MHEQTLVQYVCMIDDRLTLGPELSSKLVGRALGFYASASQQKIRLLMVMKFALVQGKYVYVQFHGSTYHCCEGGAGD